MNWYKNIKIAASTILYHGTGGQNLSSIMSNGLQPNADKLYNEELDYGSIRSYGGAYLTDNLMTALSSARKSSGKIKENVETIENQILIKQQIIVMAQIETRTPHVVLDEDLLRDPGSCLQQIMGIVIDPRGYPLHMAHFIKNNFNNQLDEITNCYLYKVLSSKHKNIDNRILEALKPYVENFIIKNAYRVLAKQIQTYVEGKGISSFSKNEFYQEFPEFSNLDVFQAESDFREAADILLRKGHRLSEYMETSFQTNLRSLETIGFSGKNKIVLIAVINDRHVSDPEYYRDVELVYSVSEIAVNKLIEDIKKVLSSNFIVEYKGEVLYDNKKEREVELV